MWLELLKSVINPDFNVKLKEVISKLGKSIVNFANETQIPEGTLYKIISDENRDFRRSTLIQIIEGVKKLEEFTKEDFIGVITTQGALDSLGKKIKINNKEFIIKEYPATSIEEEIIQGRKAEKEGVKGIICGPIAATTLEKVVDVPISTLRFENGPLMNSIKSLVNKF
jgi:predicted transcriptional regulator